VTDVRFIRRHQPIAFHETGPTNRTKTTETPLQNGDILVIVLELGFGKNVTFVTFPLRDTPAIVTSISFWQIKYPP
jgi:hypothetical protein